MSINNGNKKSTFGNVTRAELYEYVAIRINANVNDTENRFHSERIERNHELANFRRELGNVIQSMQEVINAMQSNLEFSSREFVLLRAEFEQYRFLHSWRGRWHLFKLFIRNVYFQNPFYLRDNAQPNQSVEGGAGAPLRESVDGDQCAVQPQLRLLSEPRQRAPGHSDADGLHQEDSG